MLENVVTFDEFPIKLTFFNDWQVLNVFDNDVTLVTFNGGILTKLAHELNALA